MDRLFFALGSLLTMASVMTGAFAAHALEDRLTADDLDTWQTAARYHTYHALALLAVAWAAGRWGGGLVTAAGFLFLAGIVLFSGSLYALSITGVRVLGAITPLGGLCFMIGWALLALAAVRGG